MKEKDRFIQIAGGGKKMNGEIKRLEEIKPLSFTHFSLKEGGEPVFAREEKSEEELYANYLREKEEVKLRLKPFLAKYSPNVSCKKIEINDFLYRKETEEDKKDFSLVLNKQGKWEKVKTPHYIGVTGKWNCFYITSLSIDSLDDDKRFILMFESVDYICDVYVNGRMVYSHTGFFAPFEVDVTDYVNEGENKLLLVIHNDLTTNGIQVSGSIHHGNKIYACTNIGYDEPNLGWHHCPAGAGIIGRIYLLKSPLQRVRDCFVRPNINTGEITVETTVENYTDSKIDLDVFYSVDGRNFKEASLSNIKGTSDSFQIGSNHLKETLRIPSFRLWTLDEPYLYDIMVQLKDKDGKLIDTFQTHFGFREFKMDLESKPLKGAFFFNGKRIMLRGTNEMGHLPRAVMENNFDQLVDDIAAAKVAGLNFYRMTQRPTLPQIYDYFDMMGMLCQSDFPLFSYLTDGALGEAYKQVDEMERLTRNHPSVILETFCNETLDKTAWGKEQYVLSRYDIEKFFDIAKGIVLLLNPDRVIKYSEGDYAPLKETYGISDFHCYTYWYISHGLPSGKLRKGYLPPIRKDYMCGCGEFGVDGLDSLEIMKKYAPKEWLPKKLDDPWSPKVIAKEQCYVLHGDFFPEQNTIEEWINASRQFQKEAIKEYVHSLRLRSDYLESTAVHLLIDAWPMGWTKTLIDVDRKPKPAFYAFQEANIPLRVSLRRDQFVIYQKDKAAVEIYAYNDFPEDKEVEFRVSIHYGDTIQTYSGKGIAKSVGTTYLGEVVVKSEAGYLGEVKVISEMTCDGKTTYDEVSLEIKPNEKKANKTPLILSSSLECLKSICEGPTDDNQIFVDRDYFVEHQEELEEKASLGATVFVNMTYPMNVLGKDISFRVHTLEEEVRANNLIYPSFSCEYTKEFGLLDFKNFYNTKAGYQDLTAWFKFYYPGAEEILYTLEDTPEEQYRLHKKHKLIMGSVKHGKGQIIISTLSSLDGCVGYNPVLDRLFKNIIEK
ncbi:MAG: hypothetical protein MJ239_01630 [Bacilli bacterium]|nr:hypothetical protein [Bacilli bacterium]